MILSFIFIFLVHHLITFFKNTLTTPKIKDLVNIHTEKYDAIYDVIYNANNNSNIEESYAVKEIIDISSLLAIPTMKDELKSFLKKQMQISYTNTNDIKSSTSIDLLDSTTSQI